jgi:hypothetical protein
MMKRTHTFSRVAAFGMAGMLVAAIGLTGPSVASAHGSAKKLTPKKIEKNLKALSTKVTGSKGQTFKAQYAVTIGKAQTFTYEQAPPKSLLQTPSGSVIDTGSQVLFCSSSGSASTCIAESNGTNPFASIENLFSPTSAVTFIKTAESEAAAKHSGYNVSFSTGTYAGQPSRCITYSGHGRTGEDCVTNSGILDYVATSGGHVEMTSFSKTVPSSAFTPPSGATVETLPTGVSIP